MNLSLFLLGFPELKNSESKSSNEGKWKTGHNLGIKIDIIEHHKTDNGSNDVFEVDTDTDYESIHILRTEEHQILSHEVTDCKEHNADDGLINRRSIMRIYKC